MIDPIKRLQRSAWLLIVVGFPLISAAAQQTVFQIDPAKTSVEFTLDASLHSVHGKFEARQSELRLNPASGALSGEIVVDARSGNTGNGMRDRKMHKDVLESGQYPEISFHPVHVDGQLSSQGKSVVKVRGIFNIHGVDRQIEVPTEVEISGNSWSAKIHFTVPYARWGMRNPSTFFLRVSDSVEIDFAAAGSLGEAGGTSSGSAQ